MFIGAGMTVKAGVTVTKPLPAVSYDVARMTDAVDEGSDALFAVTTTAIADGTTLFWKIDNETTSDADFVDISGTVPIANGAGSFTVTPVADQLTEGAESFHVSLRTGSPSGPVVASSTSVTVNDTSRSSAITFLGSVSSVDEGSSAFIYLTADNISNGTTIYWTTGVGGTNMSFGRLTPSTGTTTILGGNSALYINVSADQLTSPDQQSFTVYCFINAPGGSGGTLVGQYNVLINDTSQTVASGLFDGSSYIKARYNNGTYYMTPTIASFDAVIGSPPAPSSSGSLFYGNELTWPVEPGMTFTADSTLCTVTHVNVSAGNHDYTQIEFYPRVASGAVASGTPLTMTDSQPWSLGTTWTIEWWSKANGSTSGSIYTVMSQQPGVGIDIFYDSTTLAINNSVGDYVRTSGANSEPTPGVWTHVAVVNNAGTLAIYYNGIAQNLNSYVGPSWNNTALPLAIGQRGFNGDTGDLNNFQYFNGKISGIRISSAAEYTAEFDPDQILTNTANTMLLWEPTRYTPTLTMDNSSHNYPLTNTGVTIDNDAPPQIHKLTVTQRPQNDGASACVTDTSGADTIPNGATMMLNGILQTVTGNTLYDGARLIFVSPGPPSAGALAFHGSVDYTFTWYT